MGGKRNCLCLWGTWEPPKPKYHKETEPVAGHLGPSVCAGGGRGLRPVPAAGHTFVRARGANPIDILSSP
jgi:hypothetical protein